MHSRLVGLLASLTLLISGFSMTAAQHVPLKVVATYSILGDIVQNVADEQVELATLVGADGDSHVYEPTPQDVVMLSEADIIFENGLGFEPWLDDLYEASRSSAKRVVVSDDIDPLEFAEPRQGEQQGDEPEHGEYDPHIWHDPNNAIVMVEHIRAALVAADPAGAANYEASADAYIRQLQELDGFIREQVAGIPEANRVMVTTHDTFGYFGAAYGFVIDSAIESVSTEAADPSAGEIARLVTKIREAGVPAIFAENIANPDLIQRIADEAGVSVAPTLYSDALGEPGTPGETYLDMMRYNVTTIADALTPQAEL